MARPAAIGLLKRDGCLSLKTPAIRAPGAQPGAGWHAALRGATLLRARGGLPASRSLAGRLLRRLASGGLLLRSLSHRYLSL